MKDRNAERNLPFTRQNYLSRHNLNRNPQGKNWIGPGQDVSEDKHWKMDESWTFLMSYMAEMGIPREG